MSERVNDVRTLGLGSMAAPWLGLCVLTLAGCSSGPSSADYEEAVRQSRAWEDESASGDEDTADGPVADEGASQAAAEAEPEPEAGEAAAATVAPSPTAEPAAEKGSAPAPEAKATEAPAPPPSPEAAPAPAPSADQGD
jgi:hypothetical protein